MSSLPEIIDPFLNERDLTIKEVFLRSTKEFRIDSATIELMSEDGNNKSLSRI